MQWFINLKTQTKLLLSFGIIIFLFFTVLVISYNNIQDLKQTVENLYNREMVLAKEFVALRNNKNGIRASILSMALSSSAEEQKALEADIKYRDLEMQDSFKTILRLVVQNVEVYNKVEKLKEEADRIKENREEVLALISQGKVKESQTLLMETGKSKHDKFIAIAKDLSEITKTKASLAVTQALAQIDHSKTLLTVLFIVSIFIALIISFILNIMIAKPLNTMSSLVSRITNGDLTLTLDLQRTDEVGVLASNFNTMLQKLKRMNLELTETVTFLSSSASEISSSITQLAASSQETAASVSETTSTIEQVKQTSSLVNQKAKAVSESAQKTVDISQLGKKSANEMNDMTALIHAQMNLIAESMVRLSEHTQTIGSIIETVDDLSQQSNVLAVNASIEAAKAGEYGKGFFVVAEQVKSLAHQSKQATSQVRSILNDIQKSTHAAVISTEQGSKSVENGVKKSEEAEHTISILANNVNDSANAALQITASSHQQLIGMEQAAVAMENIKEAALQNVESTKQLEVAAGNLKEMSQKIKEIASQYKL